MAKITINGTSINLSGRSVTIVDGKVIIDGQDVTPANSKVINIEVHGDVHDICADACSSISVSGSVGDVSTKSGNVVCTDVLGSIRTVSGDVRCHDVRGPVESVSGDVMASTIHGRVRTVSGDIR